MCVNENVNVQHAENLQAFLERAMYVRCFFCGEKDTGDGPINDGGNLWGGRWQDPGARDAAQDEFIDRVVCALDGQSSVIDGHELPYVLHALHLGMKERGLAHAVDRDMAEFMGVEADQGDIEFRVVPNDDGTFNVGVYAVL